MINNLSQFFYRIALFHTVLLVVALTVVFVAATPAFFPDTAELMDGLPLLDAEVWYTPQTAYDTIASYTPEERIGSVWVHALWDVALPVLYTLSAVLAVSWLFRHSVTEGEPRRQVNVVPIVGGLFDLAENAGIIAMTLVYPARPAALAWVSTVFTAGKWLMLIVIAVLVLMGLFGWMQRTWQSRRA